MTLLFSLATSPRTDRASPHPLSGLSPHLPIQLQNYNPLPCCPCHTILVSAGPQLPWSFQVLIGSNIYINRRNYKAVYSQGSARGNNLLRSMSTTLSCDYLRSLSCSRSGPIFQFQKSLWPLPSWSQSCNKRRCLVFIPVKLPPISKNRVPQLPILVSFTLRCWHGFSFSNWTLADSANLT